MFQQRLLHGVAADPVELAQFGQVLAVGLAAEPLQRLPLPYPVGMQVGRLFQPQQVGNRSGVAIRKPTRRPGSRVFDTVPV